jgi:hypothetical protein
LNISLKICQFLSNPTNKNYLLKNVSKIEWQRFPPLGEVPGEWNRSGIPIKGTSLRDPLATTLPIEISYISKFEF